MQGILTENKVVIEDKKAVDSLNSRGFGSKEADFLSLDLKEAFFLMKNSGLEILKSNKAISEKQFFSFASKKEKSFPLKSLIFNDLRGRGIVTKTGFKFGFDFRAYPKGRKMGEAHSEFVVHCFNQNQAFSLNELSRMVRMSQTLHTGLLIAIVDDDQNISYFKIDREMP